MLVCRAFDIADIRRNSFGRGLAVSRSGMVIEFGWYMWFRLPCMRLMTTMPLVVLPGRKLLVAVVAFPTGDDYIWLLLWVMNNLGDVDVMRILRVGRRMIVSNGVGPFRVSVVFNVGTDTFGRVGVSRWWARPIRQILLVVTMLWTECMFVWNAVVLRSAC